MLSALPCVGRVVAAASAAEALAALEQEPPFHGVLIDARMPGVSGTELGQILRRGDRPPALVFVSATDRFAVEAFAVAALDYLLKPVTRGRLQEAVRRIALAVGAIPAVDAGMVSVDTLTGGGTRLLPRASITHLQAHGDYVRVVCAAGTFLLRARLTDLEERWQRYGFVRVHRRFLVNLHGAVEIHHHAATQAFGRGRADAQNARHAVRESGIGDQCTDLTGSNIKGADSRGHSVSPWTTSTTWPSKRRSRVRSEAPRWARMGLRVCKGFCQPPRPSRTSRRSGQR